MVDFGEGIEDPGFEVDPGFDQDRPNSAGGGKVNDNWWKWFALALVFIVIFAWLGILTRTGCCQTQATSGSPSNHTHLEISQLKDHASRTADWHRNRLYENASKTKGWPAAIAEEVEQLCKDIKAINEKIDAYHPNGMHALQNVAAVEKIDLTPCKGDDEAKYPPDPPPPFP